MDFVTTGAVWIVAMFDELLDWYAYSIPPLKFLELFVIV